MGLVLGITPSTNPTSTIIFKAMIAIKARNAIIFAPHPTAKASSIAAAELVRKAAVSAGAPKHIVGCLTNPTMQATNELMHAKEVAIIIATGGPGMVRAAYSSGKPAIGVGAGNSPAYIEKSADVKKLLQPSWLLKPLIMALFVPQSKPSSVKKQIKQQFWQNSKRRTVT